MGKTMIDLSKNQILEPAVKCWFKDDNGKFKQGELLSIDHRLKICPFVVRFVGDFEITYYSKEVFLEDPTQPKQELMTREQVMGFLANESGILVRHEESSWMMPSYYIFEKIDNFEWVKVDEEGNFLTEPSKFWRIK